jgi:DNA recombination protein Rad52
MFTPEQHALLAQPLRAELIATRQQGRGQVSYLEGWHVIAEANRIFGFDGWQRQTVELQCVSERERTIGRDQKPGWGVSYIARVRITVGEIVREGSGAGHGIDVDCGLAHESALKEAETDAMKRALMTFGDPFGLALYDKQQRNVIRQSDAYKLGEQAIAAATSLQRLQQIGDRLTQRHAAGELTAEERDQLLQQLLAREAQLSPQPATPPDPFNQ